MLIPNVSGLYSTGEDVIDVKTKASAKFNFANQLAFRFGGKHVHQVTAPQLTGGNTRNESHRISREIERYVMGYCATARGT